jgi:predicted acetyltransferase
VVREDAKPIGGLVLIPMGQWFGGKRVSMTGVAAVAVEPQVRGRGVAKHLLASTLHELRDKGVALSALYPATNAVYRAVGFEIAGSRYEVRAPCRSLAVDVRALRDEARALGDEARALSVVRLDRPDDPRIRSVYRDVAQRSPGWLDRDEYMWGRVPEWRGETRDGYAVLAGHDVLGYVFLAQRRLDTGRHNLFLSDLAASDARAALRLFAFLGDHRSLAEDVIWFGGPHDALLTVLPEQSYSLRSMLYWMLRVVDVRAALEQRGYSASVQAELHFDVRDELIAANHGRVILHLENGRATVKPGGKGRLELDVRGLAMLYSGFLSAEALFATGRLKAEKNDLARASAVFAGPAPSMPDMF